jgi:hypothetical protein
MRKLGRFVGGAVAVVLLAAAGGLVFLKTRANGFSARAKPSGLEEYLALTARRGHVTLCYMVVGDNLIAPINLIHLVR